MGRNEPLEVPRVEELADEVGEGREHGVSAALGLLILEQEITSAPRWERFRVSTAVARVFS